MAVTQTVTIINTGPAFGSFDEAILDINVVMGDESYFTYMNNLVDKCTITLTHNFDVDTQTYHMVRVFDDDDYTAWNNEYSDLVATHKSRLEAAGYIATNVHVQD